MCTLPALSSICAAPVVCRLLRGDERNFQAWAYWRALTKKMGLLPEELLDYATSKIEVRVHHRRVSASVRQPTKATVLASPPFTREAMASSFASVATNPKTATR